MERKRRKRTNNRESSTSIRIWPGVLIITVCAGILFLLVNFLGYKAGLLTMPSFMQALITGQKEEADDGKYGNTAQNLQPGLTTAETTHSYYQPENEQPTELLQSLRIPESFYQRMRFTHMDYAGNSRSWAVNLYAANNSWRLEQKNRLSISDGTSLWRCSTAKDVFQTEIGDFLWDNELGIPSLVELQSYGALYPENVSFQETTRTVYVQYIPNENSRIYCHIAVDTGLITEMQLYVNDKQVLSMYTERVSVSPDVCEDISLFTWTQENENLSVGEEE